MLQVHFSILLPLTRIGIDVYLGITLGRTNLRGGGSMLRGLDKLYPIQLIELVGKIDQDLTV